MSAENVLKDRYNIKRNVKSFQDGEIYGWDCLLEDYKDPQDQNFINSYILSEIKDYNLDKVKARYPWVNPEEEPNIQSTNLNVLESWISMIENLGECVDEDNNEYTFTEWDRNNISATLKFGLWDGIDWTRIPKNILLLECDEDFTNDDVFKYASKCVQTPVNLAKNYTKSQTE